jgi:hypothetical protein
MPTKLIMCVDIAIIFVSSFLNGIDPSPVKPASHLQWVCSKLRCPRSFGCPVCPQHLPPEVAHSFGARRIQITERFRTPPVTQDNQIYIKYIGKRASNSGVWSINCYKLGDQALCQISPRRTVWFFLQSRLSYAFSMETKHWNWDSLGLLVLRPRMVYSFCPSDTLTGGTLKTLYIYIIYIYMSDYFLKWSGISYGMPLYSRVLW